MRTNIAEALARAGVVQTYPTIEKTDPLEQIDDSYTDALEGFDGLLERQCDGALTGEVINLVRSYLMQHLQYAAKIIHRHRLRSHLRANAEAVEIREATNLRIARCADYFVAAIKEESSKVSPVLTRNTANQRPF